MLYDIGASKGIKFESRLGNVKDRKSDVREKVYANVVVINEYFLHKCMRFTLVSNLVKDVIIGLNVLSKHKFITSEFGVD